MFQDRDAPDEHPSPSIWPRDRAARRWDLQARRSPRASAERRIAPRSVTLEFRSLLGWWEREQFQVLAARLLDLSRGGVAVEAVGTPPCDRDVWFCLIPGDEKDCIAGEVVGIDRGTNGRRLIRLAFWAPCPARLLDVAIHGVAGRGLPDRSPGSE